MTKTESKEIIEECCNDIEFSCNGKHCAITSTVENYIPAYYVWNGDNEFTANSADDVMQMSVFNGKSLEDILNEIDIWFS